MHHLRILVDQVRRLAAEHDCDVLPVRWRQVVSSAALCPTEVHLGFLVVQVLLVIFVVFIAGSGLLVI